MNPATLLAKQKNTRDIVKCIVRSGEISRPSLAAALHLSTATVTNIITGLMAENVVLEGRADSTGLGRKARLLRFNAKLRYVLAISVTDSSRLSMWVCDLLGGVVHSGGADIPFHVGGGNTEELVVRRVVEAVSQFLASLPAEDAARIAAAAVSIPGIVGYNETIYAPFFQWTNLPLARPLRAAVGHPVYFENVARIKSIYELRYLEPSEKNVIYLTTSPGVGMVNFFDGKMIMGKNGISGEVGHMSLNIDGPECYCGNHGCFEGYCGELELLKRGETIANGPDACPILRGLLRGGERPLDIAALIEARDRGSMPVHALFHETARYLGSGLTSLINCFDPDRIILSGTLVEQDDYIFETAIQEARSHIIKKFTRDVQISRPHLPKDHIEQAICAYLLDDILDQLLP